MKKKYIKDLLMALIANHLYGAINKLGQAISKLLIDSPSCLQFVVTTILIVLLCWIIKQIKK